MWRATFTQRNPLVAGRGRRVGNLFDQHLIHERFLPLARNGSSQCSPFSSLAC
jgi:hypothetical protein